MRVAVDSVWRICFRARRETPPPAACHLTFRHRLLLAGRLAPGSLGGLLLCRFRAPVRVAPRSPARLAGTHLRRVTRRALGTDGRLFRPERHAPCSLLGRPRIRPLYQCARRWVVARSWQAGGRGDERAPRRAGISEDAEQDAFQSCPPGAGSLIGRQAS